MKGAARELVRPWMSFQRRRYKTLRVSPAMAAGITDELLSMEHLCKLMDEANLRKKRGPYKKATE